MMLINETIQVIFWEEEIGVALLVRKSESKTTTANWTFVIYTARGNQSIIFLVS